MVGLARYDASKHSVWGLTKNVALELAEHGIAVNALAPGAIATPGATGGAVDPDVMRESEARIPMHRMGTPDDMGRVALFLACDLSSYPGRRSWPMAGCCCGEGAKSAAVPLCL